MKTNILLISFIFIFINQFSYSQDYNAEQIYDNFKESVFVVEAYDKSNNLIGTGSCVLLSEKGIIVTNYHNFEEADELKIRHGDKYVDYQQILGVDFDKDILLLSTNYKASINLAVVNFSSLKVGQNIYALGSPYGYENSLSSGIIAGLGRTLKEISKYNLIQITSIINHGSSGGAILNSKGELIGISSFGKENIFFAIPIEEALAVKMVSEGDKSVEQNIYLYKAIKYSNDNDYASAIYFYNKYINENKTNIQSFISRGYCYLKLEKYNECKKDFEAANSLNGNLPEVYNAWGDYYFSQNMLEKSELEFRKAIKLDPNNSYAIYRRGDLYFKLNNYQIAITEYNKALEISPKNTTIILQRGIANFFNEDNISAFNDINYVLEIDPQNQYAQLLQKQFIYLIKTEVKADLQFKTAIYNAIIDLGKTFAEAFGKKKIK